MKTTGSVVKDISKESIEKVKETDAYKDVSESVKEKIDLINFTIIED